LRRDGIFWVHASKILLAFGLLAWIFGESTSKHKIHASKTKKRQQKINPNERDRE
jgi:hypothetical protein